jgi:elongation factor 3
MIKVLTGELVPQVGDVRKHPNACIAYVAQHAFHHIESHLEKSPNEYVRWRYEDKESLVKVLMVFTPQEEKLQREAIEINDIESGKKRKVTIQSHPGKAKNVDFEYEVKFIGESASSTGTFLPSKVRQGLQSY